MSIHSKLIILYLFIFLINTTINSYTKLNDDGKQYNEILLKRLVQKRNSQQQQQQQQQVQSIDESKQPQQQPIGIDTLIASNLLINILIISFIISSIGVCMCYNNSTNSLFKLSMLNTKFVNKFKNSSLGSLPLSPMSTLARNNTTTKTTIDGLHNFSLKRNCFPLAHLPLTSTSLNALNSSFNIDTKIPASPTSKIASTAKFHKNIDNSKHHQTISRIVATTSTSATAIESPSYNRKMTPLTSLSSTAFKQLDSPLLPIKTQFISSNAQNTLDIDNKRKNIINNKYSQKYTLPNELTHKQLISNNNNKENSLKEKCEEEDKDKFERQLQLQKLIHNLCKIDNQIEKDKQQQQQQNIDTHLLIQNIMKQKFKQKNVNNILKDNNNNDNDNSNSCVEFTKTNNINNNNNKTINKKSNTKPILNTITEDDYDLNATTIEFVDIEF